MWGKCITNDLYKYIFKNNNFMLLNQLGVTYQKAKKIIKMFIKENPHGLKNLINNLINDSWFINMFIVWFFQNIFLSTKSSVLQIHVNLCSIIKKWIDSKGAAASIAVTAVAKQPAKYKNWVELRIKKFEQKSIEEKFDLLFQNSNNNNSKQRKQTMPVLTDPLRAKK